ncbi:MAG: YigZ family protein [Oscillospiraceae bacterium]|jgi:uncharacterized YigZ family protein|nr:YigZ family protein [Oscillospiraceae bacterium]
MADIENYKTIASEVFSEITIKHSRFLGFAKPVKTAREAFDFLELLKREYYGAKHHVYAYSLHENGQARCSDDAEPKGSAGLPVLDVLIKNQIFDCAIVVVRYFGGVLLGKSNLTNAYRTCAKSVVKSSEIITMSKCLKFGAECNYRNYKRICDIIASFNGTIDVVNFLENIKFEFHVKKRFSDKIFKILSSFSENNLRFKIIDEGFMR